MAAVRIGVQCLLHSQPLEIETSLFVNLAADELVAFCWYALHKEPLENGSSTRLEQFRVSVGPPPLVVPRNVTIMSRLDIFGRWRG